MPQNNFWGCKLPDFHLLTGKTPFLRLLEKIQSPYTLLAAFPRTWYNREESHLGQLEFFSGCSFLIALNMILHLRIIPQRKKRVQRGSTMIPVWTKEEVLPATAASESAMAGRTSLISV